MVAAKEEDRLEEARLRREREAREMLNMKLAREEEEKRMKDPEVVAFLRGGAQAATMWCHRTPLTKYKKPPLTFPLQKVNPLWVPCQNFFGGFVCKNRPPKKCPLFQKC